MRAADIALMPERFPYFKREFTVLTDSTLAGSPFVGVLKLDAVLDEADCTQEFVEELQRLEPFWKGFSAPVFGLGANPVFNIFCND